MNAPKLSLIYKARKKLNESGLLDLHHLFAYEPYFIYCNHAWDCTYPPDLNKMIVLQTDLSEM